MTPDSHVLPDAVAEYMRVNEREELVLALEGEPTTYGVMFAGVFAAFYVIFVALAFERGSPLAGLGTAAGVALLAWLIHWGMSRAPSDVVLTRSKLHFFWRLFSKVRAEAILLEAILDARRDHDGVTVVLRDGRSRRLRLTWLSRAGVWPRYKVVVNRTGVAFDATIRDPNHPFAFLEALNTQREGAPKSGLTTGCS